VGGDGHITYRAEPVDDVADAEPTAEPGHHRQGAERSPRSEARNLTRVIRPQEKNSTPRPRTPFHESFPGRRPTSCMC
jgi:hypothetical protein